MSSNRGKSEHVGSSPDSNDESAGHGRRLVDIRCGFAEMARKEAEAAETRALEARRLFDYQSAVIAPLLAAVDPAATKAAKEKAHGAFHSSVAAARSKGQVEKVANVWLAEVNRINSENRAAQTRLKNNREALDALLSQADKLADTAESSRSMAVAAADACRSARDALVESDESETSGSVAAAARFDTAMTKEAAPAALPPAPAPARPQAPLLAQAPEPAVAGEAGGVSTDWLAIDIRAAQPQAIVRLLRRDGRTMTSLVEQLSGNEPAARSCWQLLLSNFVDAVVAAAVDEAWFEFPPGNPFWDLFTSEEAREVARGLAALGFRYDGFGVFADGRVPGQRDLALAVGAAGLLPVRIRFWPSAQQAAELYKTVTVAGDAFIATMAPAMTLGELVRLLGRRSEMLADLWNDWPRVRQLFLSRS
jgi:hypothetical protein